MDERQSRWIDPATGLQILTLVDGVCRHPRLHSPLPAATAGSLFRTSRHTLLTLGCLLGFHIPCGAAAAPSTVERVRFEVTQATLREAAAKAVECLHRRIVLKLYPSDPAHKMKVSLSMVVRDSDDLLSALTAAFGLRWLEGTKPGEVVFLDKKDYQGTEAGLRHSVAEAVPVELRAVVLSPAPVLKTPQALEQGLKELEDRQSERLSMISASGWAQVRDLEPAIARQLLEFLAGQNARQLLRAFQPLVQFARKHESELKAAPLFQYSQPGNGPTFNFRVGEHEFGVTPGV